MEQKPKKAVQAWPVIVEYFKAAKVYPWLFGAVFAGSLIIELAGILGPLYLKEFIDLLSTGSGTTGIVAALFMVLAIFALVNLMGWAGRRLQMFSVMHLEAKVMSDLSNSAFAYLMRHSHDFFVSNFAGTLTKRVNRYARSFEQVLDSITFNFFSTFVFAAGVISVIFTRSVLLGSILLAWTVLFIWIQVLMTKWRQPLRIARADEDSKVTGVLSDAVSNHSAISLFATFTYEQNMFGSAVKKWFDATMRSWNADAWIMSVQGLFALIIEIALLAGAVLLWERGLVTVGDFVLIQVYVIGLIDRIWSVGNSMRRLYDAFADADEMIVVMRTPHGIADVPAAGELVITDGAIEMKDVLFNFNENRSILKDFDLSIDGGEKVALVGPSGAGKSTVTKLLLRLYDIQDGSIEIDGQDISKVAQDSLRSAVAFVPQEPVLFHRSLMDNIRYGRTDATDEDVIDAAKKAHCHEFISLLPEGYQTHVGERGVKLSGGERQRVAIARAILKNAPILILDEATSSLDSESEHLIQAALDILMEGKTVIIIAHRLSTIMKMDRIVVIESGRVADTGTHAELLKKDGLYKKLWSIQAGGFITDEA